MNDIRNAAEALRKQMTTYIRQNTTKDLNELFPLDTMSLDQIYGICQMIETVNIKKEERMQNRTTSGEKQIKKIYTDGACSGNPGPGGYAYVIKRDGQILFRSSNGYRKTTNNRMELLAVIKALSHKDVRPTRYEVYTDSQYIVNSVNKGWLQNWAREGFVKPANKDLWKELHRILQTKEVTFNWIKGHAENPDNDWCDKEAVRASHEKDLDTDYNYESGKC